MKPRILIVDDEPGIYENIPYVLEGEGFEMSAHGSDNSCLDCSFRGPYRQNSEDGGGMVFPFAILVPPRKAFLSARVATY